MNSAHQAGLHALFFLFQIILAINGLAHVHAAEEVMVLAGDRAELRIGSEILQIGFDDRRAVRKHLDQPVFTLDHEAHDLVHGARRGNSGGLRNGR